jgi:hypothetical protein
MTNGVVSIRETIIRLAAIRRELASTKKLTRRNPKKGKRVKPITSHN